MFYFPGEKPYVCTVQGCGKRFTEYSSLYKHHVVHTHSKPYVCNHCGKTYRQTSTLAMHKRTAHGEEISSEGEAVYGPDQSLGKMACLILFLSFFFFFPYFLLLSIYISISLSLSLYIYIYIPLLARLSDAFHIASHNILPFCS